jgi:peptide/nickel transport system substrate-binding protein
MQPRSDTTRTSRSCFAATLVAAALSIASACPAPERNVLRVNDAAVGELDPHKASDYADSILMYNLYDFLVRTAPDGSLVPDLATDWHASTDGLVYTFKLRSGVRFHDGSPLEAEDVAFSINRMKTLNRGYAYLLPEIDYVEPIDAFTVNVSLKKRFAPFLAALARVAIVNADKIMANTEDGDYGSTFLSSNDAGSGSYRVVSHNPRELTLMQRFDNHYQSFTPQAPELVRLKYSMAVPTVRALMARDQHELTRISMPPEVLRALSETPGIELVQDRGSTSFFIQLNTQRAPTDDLHFRRAIALAFDYDALLRLLQVNDTLGNGLPTRGPLTPGLLGYDATLPFPRQDLTAARRELAQARYSPTEHTVEIQWVSEVGNTERVALLFQQNMAELGINVEVTRAPWSLVLDRATQSATTPHANTVDVAAYTSDPDSILTAMFHSSSSGSWSAMSWLQDSAIDARIEYGRELSDQDDRAQHYRKLNSDLIEIQPAIFGYQTATVVAKQSYVHAPQLDNPDEAVPTTGANYVFRKYALRR